MLSGPVPAARLCRPGSGDAPLPAAALERPRLLHLGLRLSRLALAIENVGAHVVAEGRHVGAAVGLEPPGGEREGFVEATRPQLREVAARSPPSRRSWARLKRALPWWGRPRAPDRLATDELTNEEDAPEWVWGATWRHLFGSKTFLEARFTGYDGYYDLNPAVNESGH